MLDKSERSIKQIRVEPPLSTLRKEVVPPMASSTHPLQAMVTDLDTVEPDAHPVPIETDGEKPETPDRIRITDPFTDSGNSPSSSIRLSGIKHPALLINRDLDIVWQNDAAIDQIWHNVVDAGNNGNPTPNIVDLLFSAPFKRRFANISGLVKFFLNHIQGLLSEIELQQRIARMPVEQRDTLSSLMGPLSAPRHQSKIYGGHLNLLLTSGRQKAFEAVALDCGEGRLLIFEPATDDAPVHRRPARRRVADRFDRIRQQPNPIETSYYLLAAQICQASMLRAEMLAEDHWRLMDALCRRCLRSVEHFGGIFGQHVEHGFFAYFLPDQNLEMDATNAIECAIEVKTEAIELGRQWKIRRDWLRDIDLNIGLHFEKAYVGTLPASSGDILTSFGEGLRVATALSRLTGDGQIWATKPVISRMPRSKNKALRFGIMRTAANHQKHFIRNGFSAIGSMFDLQQPNGSFEDALNYLPITQIFDWSGTVD
jgi:class 3 adenylate cyclase